MLNSSPIGRPAGNGRPGQADQVILNLVTNAWDAMNGIGAIDVELGRKVDAGAEDVVPRAEPGSIRPLAVRDTGTGMGPEILERIFDPFFTTKGVARAPAWGCRWCTASCTSAADMSP